MTGKPALFRVERIEVEEARNMRLVRIKSYALHEPDYLDLPDRSLYDRPLNWKPGKEALVCFHIKYSVSHAYREVEKPPEGRSSRGGQP